MGAGTNSRSLSGALAEKNAEPNMIDAERNINIASGRVREFNVFPFPHFLPSLWIIFRGGILLLTRIPLLCLSDDSQHLPRFRRFWPVRHHGPSFKVSS